MDQQQLVFAALGVATAALLLALVSVIQLRKTRKQLFRLHNGAEEQDLLSATVDQQNRLEELAARLSRLTVRVEDIQVEVGESLRHLAVVRFNALSDMGGRTSFSAAILDDHGNGIVLTSIQSNAQARIYGKTVVAGKCDTALSPEEQEAIDNARPREVK